LYGKRLATTAAVFVRTLNWQPD